MKPFIILLFSLILSGGGIAGESADGHDYLSSQNIIYTISERGQSYRLSSKVEIERVFMTERSTDEDVHFVIEHFFNDVKEPKARLNKRKISGHYIDSHILEYEDVFYSGGLYYSISIPFPIAPGDTLYYSYSEKYLDIAYLPLISVENGGFLNNLTVEYQHPEDITIDFEFFFPRGLVPFTISRPNSKRTIISFENIPEQKELPFFDYSNIHCAVLVSVKKGQTLLTPTTPEAFVGWYAGLTTLEPKLDSTHQEVLRDQVLAESTSLGRLEVIYDFVRSNIRYLADERKINAIVPHDPSQVFDLMYGDCKDRASLVAAIAREYGIAVDMALINVHARPRFGGTHVSLYDHAICYYEDADTALFFDPTQKYRSFGDVSESIIGKRALILNEGTPACKTIMTAFDDPSIEFRIAADYAAPDSASAEITLRYDLFAHAAYARKELTGIKLENYLSKLVTMRLYKIGLHDFVFKSEDEHSITFEAKASISDFIIESPNRLYIPQTPFNLLGREMAERGDDSLPIQPDDRLYMICAIDLAVPGYTATADSFSFGDRDIASYRSELVDNGANAIRLTYEYFRPTKNLSGERKAVFLELARWYMQRKKDMYILEREGE